MSGRGAIRTAPSSDGAGPKLPGYTYLRPLGVGASATVYLYRQQRPRREVAIKVISPAYVAGQRGEAFGQEADLMAAVSHHPAIVTVHDAGLAAGGQAYLVMEYCPGPTLAARMREESIPVSEVLALGIRLAGAVETAHRAGVVHRDIKPANVLTTAWGGPALTDFGVAALGDDDAEATGMSIPWAAPELLDQTRNADARSDLYSLGATLYSALAGRAPFARPGENAAPATLISRTLRDPLPPIGRSDVPAELEAVLARAMDKRPEARYPSALEFARALQGVEAGLGLGPTSADVAPEPAPPVAAVAGEGTATAAEQSDGERLDVAAVLGAAEGVEVTRLTRPVVAAPGGEAGATRDVGMTRDLGRVRMTPPTPPRLVHQEQPRPDADATVQFSPTKASTAPTSSSPAAPDITTVPDSSPAPDAPSGWDTTDLTATPTSQTGPPASALSATSRVEPDLADAATVTPAYSAFPATPVSADQERRAGRMWWALWAGAGVIVVAAVVALVLANSGAPGPQPVVVPSSVAPTLEAVVQLVPSPGDIAGTTAEDGTVTFTWSNPEPLEGDQYLWGLVHVGSSDRRAHRLCDIETVTIAPAELGDSWSGPVCIEVYLVRADQRMSSTPAEGCAS